MTHTRDQEIHYKVSARVDIIICGKPKIKKCTLNKNVKMETSYKTVILII